MAMREELHRINPNANTVAANWEAYWRALIAAGMTRAAHFGPEAKPA